MTGSRLVAVPANLTVDNVNVVNSTVPANGIFLTAANTLGIATAGVLSAQVNPAGNIFGSVANGYAVINAAASGVNPTLIPNRSSTTTGIGAQASGNISFIVGAAEQARVVATGLTIIAGKALTLGNAAVTGLTPGVLAATTNATLVLTDSAGQAYRIPCII